jgi:hypothetical protein
MNRRHAFVPAQSAAGGDLDLLFTRCGHASAACGYVQTPSTEIGHHLRITPLSVVVVPDCGIQFL